MYFVSDSGDFTLVWLSESLCSTKFSSSLPPSLTDEYFPFRKDVFLLTVGKLQQSSSFPNVW